jgi:hypothetical protein
MCDFEEMSSTRRSVIVKFTAWTFILHQHHRLICFRRLNKIITDNKRSDLYSYLQNNLFPKQCILSRNIQIDYTIKYSYSSLKSLFIRASVFWLSLENEVTVEALYLVTLLLIEVVNRRDQTNISRKVFGTLLNQSWSCLFLQHLSEE